MRTCFIVYNPPSFKKKKKEHLFCLSCKVNSEKSTQITNAFQNVSEEKKNVREEMLRKEYVVIHIFLFSKGSEFAQQKIGRLKILCIAWLLTN